MHADPSEGAQDVIGFQGVVPLALMNVIVGQACRRGAMRPEEALLDVKVCFVWVDDLGSAQRCFDLRFHRPQMLRRLLDERGQGAFTYLYTQQIVQDFTASTPQQELLDHQIDTDGSYVWSILL